MSEVAVDPIVTPKPVKKTCSVDECERPVFGRGLCQLHHRRMLRSQSTERRNGVAKGRTCECGDQVVAKGRCRSCYDKWTKSRMPVRDRDTMCVHGGQDDRPTIPPGHIRVMLCRDEMCFEVWHCDTRPEGFDVDDIELFIQRQRQLTARLRSLDWS